MAERRLWLVGSLVLKICSVYILPLGRGKAIVQRIAPQLFHIHLNLHNTYTKTWEASFHNRLQQFKALWFVALPNGPKVLPLHQTGWCLLSGISLPHMRCYTTSGNLRQSWTPFQHDVCWRLVRRRVIERRKGWCVSEGWNQPLLCRQMDQILNSCIPLWH